MLFKLFPSINLVNNYQNVKVKLNKYTNYINRKIFNRILINSFNNIDLISIENRGYNAQGTPLLAMVINLGLEKLLLTPQVSYDYIICLKEILLLMLNYMKVMLKIS